MLSCREHWAVHRNKEVRWLHDFDAVLVHLKECTILATDNFRVAWREFEEELGEDEGEPVGDLDGLDEGDELGDVEGE